MQMTDEDVILRLQEICGGTVGRPSLRGDDKQLYRRQRGDRDGVAAIGQAIHPWLGQRRHAQLVEMGTRTGVPIRCSTCRRCPGLGTPRRRS